VGLFALGDSKLKFIYKEHYHKGVVWSLFDGSGGAVIGWAKAVFLANEPVVRSRINGK